MTAPTGDATAALFQAAARYARAQREYDTCELATPREEQHRTSDAWQNAHHRWFRRWRTVRAELFAAKAALHGSALAAYPVEP